MLKTVLRTVVSLAMSALFVWLSLRHADVRAVGAAIAHADPLRIVGYLGIWLVIHLVRTVRWGILLEKFGRVGFKRLNSASAVGFMLLILLPLRLGEFARPLLIARPPSGAGSGTRIRRSAAFASIVVERIVDGIAIGLLGVVSLRILGRSASGEYVAFARKASVLVALGFGVLCVGLLVALFFREQALRFTRRVLLPISPRLAEKGASMLEAFIDGLHLGSGWKVLAFFALTASFWTLNGLGLALLAPAFGFNGLTPLMIAVILTIQVVGVMVPAGPGMVGTLQFFTQAGLSLFVTSAFADPRAVAFANTIWMLQFVAQVGLGLVFLLSGHVSLKGVLGRAPPEEESPPDGAPAAP